MKSGVRPGLKGRFPHEKNKNKNLDVLCDLYYSVVREHCGRIDDDYVQSALSIRLLKENHSKYHKMLCCTHSVSACWLLVFTAPVLLAEKKILLTKIIIFLIIKNMMVMSFQDSQHFTSM